MFDGKSVRQSFLFNCHKLSVNYLGIQEVVSTYVSGKEIEITDSVIDLSILIRSYC